MRVQELLPDAPRPLRYATGGAEILGLLGGIAGLVIGLIVNPPTAWFAVFELGVPATAAGAILGVIAGVIVTAVRTVKSHR